MNDKEKIEEAKRLYESANADQRYVLESLFPELAESEDERMKKAIMHVLYENYTDAAVIEGVEIAEIVAWLEKQAPVKFNDEKDERIRKEILEFVTIVADSKSNKREWIAWIEKQGVQEEHQVYETKDGEIITYSETDGYKVVEPKFRVGDWIACEELNTAFIVNVDDDRYEVEFIDGNKGFPHIDYVDRLFHLWSIEDAKGGDVLYSGQMIFIFNKINGIWINCHCSLHKDKSFINESYDLMHIKYSEEVYPATKEQRDTLMKAMADAGYTFNFEKKELKKIDQKSYGQMEKCIHCQFNYTGYCNGTCILKNNVQKTTVWSEDDDAYKLFAISAVEDYYGEENPLQKALVDWLKSLKERVQTQTKQEWSESDKEEFQIAIDTLVEAGQHDSAHWLKSLKQRGWRNHEHA